MAYKRVVNLKAGTEDFALLVSALHIKFEVNRSRKFEANTAKIKIYNPSETTINDILKKGNSIVLEAGYEDEGTGVIFIGQITSSVPNNDNINTTVEIECQNLQGADKTLQTLVVSLSYKPDTSISSPLQDIAKVMGLATYGLENTSGITMKGGYVFTGIAKQALRYCKDILEKNGLIVYIDNDSLIITSEVDPKETRTASLNPGTGLLNAAPLKTTKNKGKKEAKKLENKVSFTSILNPQIVPNKYIEIDNKRNISGLYVVDKCKFTGANFGTTPYTVSGEAIGVE